MDNRIINQLQNDIDEALAYNEDIYQSSDHNESNDDHIDESDDGYSDEESDDSQENRNPQADSDSDGEDCQVDDLNIPCDILAEKEIEPLKGKYNGSIVLKFTQLDSFKISSEALGQLLSVPLKSLTIIRPQKEMQQAGFLTNLMNQLLQTFDFKDLQSFTLNMPINVVTHNGYQPLNQYQTVLFRRQFLFTLLSKLTKECVKLTKLKLKLNSWYSGEDKISESNVNIVIQQIQDIILRNENLKYFSLNCFQWGYYNQAANNSVVQTLCSALQKRNLEHLTLDIGRWGCEDYRNYRIFNAVHTKMIAQTLQSQRNLQYLSLNFRSWGYNNTDISDVQVIELIDGIQQLPLTKIHIELSKWKYANTAITHLSIQKLALCISQMKTLRKVSIDLSGWEYSNVKELQSYGILYLALTFLTELRKKPNLRLETTVMIPLKNQISLVEKILNQIIQENKNRLYLAKQVQQFYGNLLRNEMIGDVIEQCTSFNFATIKTKVRDILNELGSKKYQMQNEENNDNAHGQNLLLAILERLG